MWVLCSRLISLSLWTPNKLTFVSNIFGTNKLLLSSFLAWTKNEKMVNDNKVLFFHPYLFILLYLFLYSFSIHMLLYNLSHVIYVYILHVLVVYIVGAIIHMLTICKYLRICIHTHICVCVYCLQKPFKKKKNQNAKYSISL